MQRWNHLLILLSVLLLNCQAAIEFDKVETKDPTGSSEEVFTPPAKRTTTSTSPKKSLKLQVFRRRDPVNRPRRDHQYATYKVPKNHVLVADYGGWTPRQLSSFAATNLLGPGGPQGPPNDYPYPSGGGGGGMMSLAPPEEEDNVVAAGGHGHSHHEHGHGGGWGWGQSKGHQKYKKSEVNSSAVGMLGFLGLLALVQMNNNNNAGAGAGTGIGGGGGVVNPGGGGVVVPPGGRKKRSVTASPSPNLYETTAGIVPYLLNLNQVREGEWPLYCSSYQVCMLSKVAGQGATGRNEKQLIKNALTSVIGEMLAPRAVNRKDKADLRKMIDWAANVGLKGEKCDTSFKECKLN